MVTRLFLLEGLLLFAVLLNVCHEGWYGWKGKAKGELRESVVVDAFEVHSVDALLCCTKELRV